MFTLPKIASAMLALGAFRGAYAGFDPNAKTNVVVYWGQNSHGQGSGPEAQQRLGYYCKNYPEIDVIPLAFVTVISDQNGLPQMNFANQGCNVFPGTNTMNCPDIANDIHVCQNTYNKTILLSLGGATYTQGGFSSPSAAQLAARMLWQTFGPLSSPYTTSLRPFSTAAIDGFDLDFESATSNMKPFADELRRLMDTQPDGKRRFLTAAPQCPYPDYADKDFLDGGSRVDAVFVQFYNNYCGVNSFVPGAAEQWNFNMHTWDDWARRIAGARPNAKVLVGVPASSTAAGSGYLSPDRLRPVLEFSARFPSFAGVMLWDASQMAANAPFVQSVKSVLEGVRAADENAQLPLCRPEQGAQQQQQQQQQQPMLEPAPQGRNASWGKREEDGGEESVRARGARAEGELV
ncbi:glycoside hydrolase family 18 protein [Aplosporella prunicola CBS 121167]|uniref:chitinase n=1 Tax=Aplosporella prunicola CBS 121167 TaxID=1176127 RepID=A0A6A6BGN5_9PEZI|nr:glycoside hydrolase family 18 protein [Aplosporella prunicola CBS 121167]KAF2142758.1 glycoside hydrolase family 18 protein [Aplosporella prunicola CBS 121167]